jgi:hypothetical protein
METFTMSSKEVLRAGLVKAALAGKITNAEGGRALGLTARQFRRLKHRVRAEGMRGLLHRSRGRPSPRRVAAAVVAQVTAFMTTIYDGFNDVHLTEKLQERHALAVSRSTVRRLRLALGRPATRRRRAPQHRRRRARAPARGQLVQLDASLHAWLEQRGPAATLHGLIDDATSWPLALWFQPTEDLHGYLTVLGQACRAYGVPVTLYGDRLNLFQRNDRHWTLAEQLRGAQDPTHFGRVLAALGIGFIPAQSPQAKGRIERFWNTLQDRLVSELRLRGIATLEDANAFLPEFLADFAPRFAQPPAQPTPAWRPAPRDLAHILCCRYERTVGHDNTVRLGPRVLQIPPGPGGRSYSGCRVEVRELLDGRLLAFYQTVLVGTQAAPAGFVLTPRRNPGAARPDARRGQQRRAAALQRALTALAPAPARRPARGGAAASAAGPTAPAHPALPLGGAADTRPPARTSRPAPTHPWRQPLTARLRRAQSKRTFSRNS